MNRDSWLQRQLAALQLAAGDRAWIAPGSTDEDRALFAAAGCLPAADDESAVAAFDATRLRALPPAQRAEYARCLLARLAVGGRALLVVDDYPPAEMPGPPYGLPQAEIRALFGAHCDIAALGRIDVLAREPQWRERGLTRLHECGWLLVRRA